MTKSEKVIRIDLPFTPPPLSMAEQKPFPIRIFRRKKPGDVATHIPTQEEREKLLRQCPEGIKLPQDKILEIASKHLDEPIPHLVVSHRPIHELVAEHGLVDSTGLCGNIVDELKYIPMISVIFGVRLYATPDDKEEFPISFTDLMALWKYGDIKGQVDRVFVARGASFMISRLLSFLPAIKVLPEGKGQIMAHPKWDRGSKICFPTYREIWLPPA